MVLLVAVAGVAIASTVAFVAYEFGQRVQQRRSTSSDVFSVQATLALFHYKSYERIERLLGRKCFDDARRVAAEMSKLQVVLLSDQLRATSYSEELVEYVKVRDPELLKNILAGQVPILTSYETTCG